MGRKLVKLDIDPEFYKELETEAKKNNMPIDEFLKVIMEQRSEAYGNYYQKLQGELSSYEGSHKGVVRELPKLIELLASLLEPDTAEDLSREGIQETCIALGYVFLPDDVIPEEIYGEIGYIDDVFLCSYVLHDFVKSGSRFEDLIRNNWQGEGDIIELLEELREKSQKIIQEEGRDTEEVLQYLGLK